MGVNNQTIYQMTIPVNDIMKQATGVDEVKNASTEYVSVAQVFEHNSPSPILPEGCEMGVFTPETDELTHTVSHSLGVVPHTAVVVGVLNGSRSEDNKTMIMIEYLGTSFTDNSFDISKTQAVVPHMVISINGTTGREYQSTNTYSTNPASMTDTEVTFATGRYYNGKFKAGKSYVYLITK